ncbi:MAG TPA: hypothetical protein VMH61_01215 [Candidatus Acidoferrales bacterium]|nr:hypothetical protein [Candidatus Acidoferrales bacterium]
MHASGTEGVRLLLNVSMRLAVSAAVLAWGVACTRRAMRARFPAEGWDLRVLGGAVFFASALLVPALLLGAAGWLKPWTWAPAAVLAFALLRRPFDAPGAAELEPVPNPTPLFTIALSGFALARLVYTLRNPPVDWDSFHYHLPMVAAWLGSGWLGVPLHVPPPFGQYFPGSGELLEAWLGWSAGRDTLMPWIGVLGLWLLGFALRRLALMCGARRALAEAVAIALAAAPGLAQLTLGAKVDLLLGAWLAIALLFAMRLRTGAASADAALLVGALGLLPGVKTTGPIYAALLLGIALLGRRMPRRLTVLASRRVAIAVAIFSGAFWYARNALATGNPLFPAEVGLGRFTLPGLMSRDDLRRTTQLEVWREGMAGHTTLANVLRFYGPALALLAIGALAWAPFGARALTRPDARARACALLAVVFAAFYLVTPFSGLYLPSVPGLPPRLNFDNLRLLLPALIALAPVAAAGLSRFGPPLVPALALGALWLFGLGTKLAHVLPGIVLVAVLALLVRLARSRLPAPMRRASAVATTFAAVAALALGVTRVDAARERVEAGGWGGHLARIHNLPWDTLRSLRARAAGRRIATSGVASWWGLYGRDFSGRPVYVPVDEPWASASGPFNLLPERRTHPDRALWLENLGRANVAFVVVGCPDESCRVVMDESRWCRDDPAHFEPVEVDSCAAAYRFIADVPVAARGTSAPTAGAAR